MPTGRPFGNLGLAQTDVSGFPARPDRSRSSNELLQGTWGSIGGSARVLSDADRLIMRLAKLEEMARPEHRKIIVGRLLEAGFSQTARIVEKWDAKPYTKVVGTPHPQTGEILTKQTVLTSDLYHLAKRIAEGEWPTGTSIQSYLADLKGAIASPEAEIYIGFQGGTPKVGVVGPLRPAPEGGPNPLGDRVFVVYNARTGELVTGYRIGAHEKARAVKSWRPCQ